MFLKYWHVEQLNEALDRQHRRVVDCQRIVRGHIARRQVRWVLKVAQQRAGDLKVFCNQLAQHGDQTYYVLTKQQEHDRERYLEKASLTG